MDLNKAITIIEEDIENDKGFLKKLEDGTIYNDFNPNIICMEYQWKIEAKETLLKEIKSHLKIIR